MPREVSPHSFLSLVSRYQHTCAAAVPMLMWSDPIHPEHYLDNELLHEDFCSLYIVRQGRGIHVIDGAPYSVARGDVYVMGTGSVHHFENVHDLMLDTIHFLPDVFDRRTLDALADTRGFHALFVAEPLQRPAITGSIHGRWLHLTPTAYETVMAAHAELYAEWSSGTPEGLLLTQPLFLRLLVMLARLYASDQSEQGLEMREDGTVAAALTWIEANFREPIRVEEAARRVFLSPDRFTEVFQTEVGRTPREYIRHLRMEYAKKLLLTTELPISEVGQEAGFGEPGYFARAFRQSAGITPRKYRNQRRAEARPRTQAESATVGINVSDR